MRVRRDLTVSLGFRDEFSTGWNEANGQAANYDLSPAGPVCASQPATNVCLPRVGDALFTTNNADFLPQPRVGVAWKPFDDKTVIRAGRGRLQRSAGCAGLSRRSERAVQSDLYHRCDGLGDIFGPNGQPISPSAPPPTSPLALLVPGGVQPDMQTPTLVSYSVRVERELGGHMTLTRRVRRQPRLPRDHRRRRKRRGRGRLSGLAVPRDVSDDARSDDASADLWRARRTAGAGRDVLQSNEHQAEHRAGQHVDVGVLRTQHLQRAADRS